MAANNLLYLLKGHIALSFHIEKDNFSYQPFDVKGGLGRMWKLFGKDPETILDEMNEALAV